METHRPRYAVHAALIVICLVLACPALYALQVSTLTLEEAFTVPPKLFPPSTDFYGNVSSLFTDQNFGQLMLNTLNVSMLVVVVKTLFAMLAGLAFVYFDFPSKWLLFFFILLTLLMPTELILMPLSGLMPAPFEAVCSATHAAARALMESLRYELWDEKIQCTSACLDGVFAPDFELGADRTAEAAAKAVLEGISRNEPVVIWPEESRRTVDACGPSTDERQACLLKDARTRKAGMRTKGAYI